MGWTCLVYPVIRIENRMNITPEQIDALDALQAKQNQGRGVQCVKNIVTYLRKGDYNSALLVRQSEGDKTGQYQELEQMLYSLFGCRTHGKHNCASFLCKNTS